MIMTVAEPMRRSAFEVAVTENHEDEITPPEARQYARTAECAVETESGATLRAGLSEWQRRGNGIVFLNINVDIPDDTGAWDKCIGVTLPTEAVDQLIELLAAVRDHAREVGIGSPGPNRSRVR